MADIKVSESTAPPVLVYFFILSKSTSLFHNPYEIAKWYLHCGWIKKKKS